MKDEVGDLLFTVVNLARLLNVDQKMLFFIVARNSRSV